MPGRIVSRPALGRSLLFDPASLHAILDLAAIVGRKNEIDADGSRRLPSVAQIRTAHRVVPFQQASVGIDSATRRVVADGQRIGSGQSAFA